MVVDTSGFSGLNLKADLLLAETAAKAREKLQNVVPSVVIDYTDQIPVAWAVSSYCHEFSLPLICLGAVCSHSTRKRHVLAG
jgi:hypothetical protein